MKTNKAVEEKVLAEVKKSEPTPQELHRKLSAHTSPERVREAVSKLWDEGEITLSSERRLKLGA